MISKVPTERVKSKAADLRSCPQNINLILHVGHTQSAQGKARDTARRKEKRANARVEGKGKCKYSQGSSVGYGYVGATANAAANR